MHTWEEYLLIFRRSVVSESLRPPGLQHIRLPCPSPTPKACSNSCPLSHDAIKPLIFHRPLLLPTSIFPSIRVFSNELALWIRWLKSWSFSFSINPSNDYSGLISFRIDRFDLSALEETFKSLLLHHSSKASIFLCSAFFMVQLSDPYRSTGKNIALTIQTFFSKVMSLLFSLCCV